MKKDSERTWFEIWVQVGDQGGPFTPKDPSRMDTLSTALVLFGELHDSGEYDQVILLRTRQEIVAQKRKYKGEG